MPPRGPPPHAPDPPGSAATAEPQQPAEQAASDEPDPPKAALRGPALYQALVESVADYAIFALDAEGRVLTWNVGAERLKGYRAPEIVGRHFSTFYLDQDVARGKPWQELRLAAEQGRHEDEGWRERKDGSRFWANVVITALRDPESGALVGFSKVTRDLTERRNVEEALRESEEQYRMLVDAVQDYAIFLLDREGNVATWNTGAQRLKGYRPKEIVGRHFSVFYTEPDLARDYPRTELKLAGERGRYEDEGWRLRKDGSRFWANVIITALRDANGRLLGFSKITRDLTARKQMEDELRRRVDERTRALAMTNQELEAFNYTVSHDLRAPLRGISIMADATMEDHARDLPPDVARALGRVRDEAQRASRLVEDLLSFSRVDRHALTMETVDVAALAREALARLRSEEPARRVDLAAPERAEALADPALAGLVVENLLSNAWKFTRNREEARIELGVAGDEPAGAEQQGLGECTRVFYVRDNGAGFDPAKMDRLFMPFQRLHSSKDFAGTGIGLSTVRRIVERHGGRVWAEGARGEGATFFFTLPAPPVE